LLFKKIIFKFVCLISFNGKNKRRKMEKQRLIDILHKIKNVKIGVIGDFCVDAYWLLDDGNPEYSLETNKKTFAVIKQKYSLGGAGNVIWNLADLGIEKAYAFGVIGDDLFGREMINLLNKLNVDTNGMITQAKDWDTPVYSKPYLGFDEQERIDFGRYNKISTDTEKKLLEIFESEINKLDAVIINQQLKQGIYSESIIKSLNDIIMQKPEKIFLLDSRNKNDRFYNVVFKINGTEAAKLCGEDAEISESIALTDLERYSKQIYQRAKRSVFISRGSRGIVYFDGNKFDSIPGIQINKKTDTVGAGDTVASAITACLSVGVSISEAAEIANLSAGVTVQKILVTGTANQTEIIDMHENANYIYHPELADDYRNSKFHKETEIEIINGYIQHGNIKHVVFDHDGTISTLRQGWEDIMEPVMIKSILGKQYNTINEEMYQRVKKRVNEYIDQSTGIETIVQMHSLVEIINEFGFIPKDEVLSPIQYKEIYNTELLNKVNKRLIKLKNNELDVSDFVVKGILKFFDLLKNNDIKMYLASGTDTMDVMREAESLGYAHYFEGRIYGSIGDITKNVKRIVIEKIISSNKLDGNSLAVFGDGPVEIREVKRRGGIAIGVASDEVRRYSLSLNKRSRLIKSGADYIIPDFSQSDKLSDLLFK
jgi:rfaE bifunctional protein kinase chain/domain